MTLKRRCLLALCWGCLAVGGWAQRVVVHEQVAFPDSIPAGGYSGITYLGDNRYAVVTDNTQHAGGFYLFDIQLDSVGALTQASCRGFKGNGDKGHDNEGIAWFPPKRTVFVSGEADNQVRELNLEGKPTGRRLNLPKVFAKAGKAYGIEALTYNEATHRFWLTSESTLTGDGPKADPVNGAKNRLRLQSFNDQLQPVAQYVYEMDAPDIDYQPTKYAMGVSALAAMDDGRILVLEREFAIPESKLGTIANCKIYEVKPAKEGVLRPGADIAKAASLPKRLVAEWSTALGLLDFSVANYEGMCLGPKLNDGGQVVVLVADSQYQYAGILADWLKTVVIY